MAKKASLDEFMSKRQQSVGKTNSGKDAVFKGFSAPPSYDAATRSGVFVMSSERIDRMGDIVRQKGMDTVEFEGNPQGLLFHSSRAFPVGLWSDLAKKLRAQPPRTEGTLTLAPSGGPISEIEQAAWAVENGLIRTVSIGFIPLEMEIIEHEEGVAMFSWGFDIITSELLECSLVPIPAQPDAHAKGMLARGEAAPAREFIEQALDEWAKDPRTGMLIPRKDLESTYRRHFGKDAIFVMAVDQSVPREKSALSQLDAVWRKTLEDSGIKQIGDPPSLDATDIAANSGISIQISISQDGGTGGNTRVGTDVGDTGTAAADDNVQSNGTRMAPFETVELAHRGERVKIIGQGGGSGGHDAANPSDPASQQGDRQDPPRRKLIDVLWQLAFGKSKPDPTKTLVPGAFAERKDRIEKMKARLQPE